MRLRNLCNWLEAASPPRLAIFLAVAVLLRLPAVLWARGYEFADHQFQYVEPAYHLAFDAAWWRPWEYERGLRSWAYPGLLAGMLRTVDAGPSEEEASPSPAPHEDKTWQKSQAPQSRARSSSGT